MRKKLFLCLFAFLSLIIVSGCGKSKTLTEEEKEIEKNGGVKIVASETSKIEYEKFDNSLVSLDIPKGWKVEVAPYDYIHYAFKVYNPENPNYMLLFALKFEGYFKSDLAKTTWKNYYPTSPLAKLPVLNDKTTEGFYKIWNITADSLNSESNFTFFPKIFDYKTIQKLGEAQFVGGDILRATFKDSNGNLLQGLLTASVKDVGSYYVNVNWNPLSKKVDVWPMNVYNIVMLIAPDTEFNNWQPILDHCLGTVTFSEKFMSGFNSQEQTIMNTVKTNQQVYNQISDMIMDSWNKRSNSYDIISQKQSDATLGYERVYDTETGNVYRAYNGFTDEYQGERYKTVTDDMYTSEVKGYIEK